MFLLRAGENIPQQEYIPIDTTISFSYSVGLSTDWIRLYPSESAKRWWALNPGSAEFQTKKQMRSIGSLIPQDLIKYGMIPELVGRIPVVSIFSELDVKDLVNILTQPKNAIVKQFQKLFELENVKLDFNKDALDSDRPQIAGQKAGGPGI